MKIKQFSVLIQYCHRTRTLYQVLAQGQIAQSSNHQYWIILVSASQLSLQLGVIVLLIKQSTETMTSLIIPEHAKVRVNFGRLNLIESGK